MEKLKKIFFSKKGEGQLDNNQHTMKTVGLGNKPTQVTRFWIETQQLGSPNRFS